MMRIMMCVGAPVSMTQLRNPPSRPDPSSSGRPDPIHPHSPYFFFFSIVSIFSSSVVR